MLLEHILVSAYCRLQGFPLTSTKLRLSWRSVVFAVIEWYELLRNAGLGLCLCLEYAVTWHILRFALSQILYQLFQIRHKSGCFVFMFLSWSGKVYFSCCWQSTANFSSAVIVRTLTELWMNTYVHFIEDDECSLEPHCDSSTAVLQGMH